MEVLKFIQQIHNPFLDQVFINITKLGEQVFLILALGIIFWCINKKAGYKIGFALLSSTLLNSTLKNIINEKRPIGAKGIRSLRTETATGSSFPSGHTQGTAAFWTGLMLWIKKLWIYILGTLVIMLVGISRMYLGVHWLQDVLVGAVLGVLWTIFTSFIFDYCEKTEKKTYMLIIMIPALIGLIFFRDKGDYINSLGVLLGFYIGYIIEGKYINFEVKTTIPKQIIKVVIGLAGVAIMFLISQHVPYICSLFVFMLLGIWVTVGAPMIFKKIVK